MLARALRRTSVLGKSSRAFAALGDQAPAVDLDVSFPGPKCSLCVCEAPSSYASRRRRLRVVSRRAVNFAQRCKGRRVILLGLPGAFTPT